jgi:hypothetical protein
MKMCRLMVVLGCGLVLGCGDGQSGVERRFLAEPESAEPKTAADDQSEASPHGTSPHGTSPHGTMPPETGGALPGGEMDLGAIRLTAPKTWVRKPPLVNFILAEFSLPRAEGDPADARLTVTIAGGTIDENVSRWRQQFGEKPEKEAKEQVEVGGTRVSVVDFAGTYHDQRGPMAPAAECPGYRMLGAIFEAGGQMHFIKCSGPAKTVSAHAAEFRSFLESLKLSPPSR